MKLDFARTSFSAERKDAAKYLAGREMTPTISEPASSIHYRFGLLSISILFHDREK